MKPIIGITGGFDGGKRKDSLRPNRELYYLNRSYVLAIQKAGGIPLVLPPLDDLADIDKVLNKIDGLLLIGGHDIYPEVYGAKKVHPKTETLEWLRQEYELALTKRALKQGIPLLAICLGNQMLNVAAGGTLIQDIPSEVNNPLIHSQKEKRDKLTHWVTIDKSSILYRIVKQEKVQSNSFHHQAINRVAPGFKVVAKSDDGIIETIESTDSKFRLGVQWHPEELIKYPNHLALFKALVKRAKHK
ncbi:MAG: gamma-glutamyl-gamma-aminobutyrate hydrolase family protein [bacterium]|nr:gamma-glutamyl-gamma-aminobutyrate hydrolase family protein [bacterium]